MTALHPLQESGSSSGCPLCASTQLAVIAGRDRTGAALQTAHCQSCGHVFVHPLPGQTTVDAYYATKYREAYKAQSVPQPKHIFRAGLRAMERLARLSTIEPPAGTLLDIGAGGGEFTYLANRAGYTAAGLEPHEGYSQFARQVYGVQVVTGSVFDLEETESCDVITLHHVLEHLSDPERGLGVIHSALKPNGLFMLEVPDVESTAHSPRQKFHVAHLHHFNREGLTSLLSNVGFHVVDVSSATPQKHLNILSRKQPTSVVEPRHPDVADRVAKTLAAHTPLAHHLSWQPYRRLWANLTRPVREGFGRARLGNPDTPKNMLDCLWDAQA